jgi:hypothetical protein
MAGFALQPYFSPIILDQKNYLNKVSRIRFKAIKLRLSSLTRSHRFGNGEFAKLLEEAFFNREETKVDAGF